MQPSHRIAMWSGPRSISTAMLRSWGNRPDTHVCDEPLYACYLERTGHPHPGAGEIIRRCETDWRKVVAELTGPIPGGKRIFYQKHMAHHLLDHVGRGWLRQLDHAFLIRDPKGMLLSLDRVTPNPRLADTGLPQQVGLFEQVRRWTGRTPPVVDSRDVLENPERILVQLCGALGVSFLAEMLAWPPGKRESDGIWASHWYASVERSTGFSPPPAKSEPLPPRLEEIHAQCMEPYQHLLRHRIRA